MIKRILKGLIGVILTFSMIFGTAFINSSFYRMCIENIAYGESGSYSYIAGNAAYTYQVRSDGSIYIEEYKGTDPKVVIPESINGKKVTAIGVHAFSECKTLEEVVIPDTVTEICAWSFADCSNLKKVKISNNAEYIGGSAFMYCSSLESIEIPDSATEVWDYAFADCTQLKYIKLSENTTYIGDGAFRNCCSLRLIDIPDNVEYISENAFPKSVSSACPLEGIKITSCISGIESNSNLNVTFKGTYKQNSARSMTAMINDFRTGSQAWAWNSSDTEKIYYSGLGILTYDYELEKVAMQRAAELVAMYSHTRPDGSGCFTAYTDTYINTYMGENIAIGISNLDAEKVFELWREDEEQYSGQGHRRNMLNSSYKAVGIAHVYYEGCHYWVQEFSSKIGSNIYTEPNDSESDMTVSISPSFVEYNTLRAEYNSKNLLVNEYAPFPKVYNVIKTSTWLYAPVLEYEVLPKWSVTSGSSALQVSGNNYIGMAEGNAVLTGNYDNKIININVRIKNNVILGDVNGDDEVDIKDSALIKRYLAGWEVDMNMEAADMDSDGDVTIKDSALIKRQLAGWE